MANLTENLAYAQQAIAHTKTRVHAAGNLREDRLRHEGGIEAIIARYRRTALPPPATAPPPQTFQQKLQFFERGGTTRQPRRPGLMSLPEPRALIDDLLQSRTNYRLRARAEAAHLGRQLTRKESIELSAETAAASTIGNCWEQAATAIIYLRDLGVRPLDFMYFTSPGYDHAFTIIGRAQFSNLSNLRTWGPTAVWCDPWQGGSGRSFAISEFIAGRVRNLDAVYKLNTHELVGAGKPISFYRIG